jgi:hypothetical protein
MKHRAVHNPRPKLRNPSPEKLDALLHEDLMRSAQFAPLSDGAIEARRRIAAAQLKYMQQEKAMPDMKTAIHNAMSEQRKATIKEVVDAWSDDEPTPQPQPETPPNTATQFKTTVGVSQASFNYIRDNPYLTTMQAVDELEKKGFKRGSTISLLSQMVRQGLMSKDKDGKLTALVKEFRPLKSTHHMAKIAKLVKKVAAKKAKPKAAVAPKAVPFQFPEEEASWPRPERQAPTVTIDVRAIKERNAIRAGIATLNAPHAQATPAAEPAPKLLTAEQVLKTLSVKEAHVLYRELQTMFG